MMLILVLILLYMIYSLFDFIFLYLFIFVGFCHFLDFWNLGFKGSFTRTRTHPSHIDCVLDLRFGCVCVRVSRGAWGEGGRNVMMLFVVIEQRRARRGG